MKFIPRFALVLLASLGIAACSEVPPGHEAVSVTQGSINGVERAGLVWHGPLTEIIPISLQTQKLEGKTIVYTKDVQQATVKYTVNYRLAGGKTREVFERYGVGYADLLMPQVIEESIKNQFGQSKAVSDAINRRGMVQAKIFDAFRKKMAKKNIVIEGFEINDVSFSDAFDKANEDKQIAVENATKEKNNTVAVRERAEQKVITAKADAEAMKIKSQALSGNPGLTAYEYAIRWDGKMPTYVTGDNAPMMMQVR
ncbi:high frequency of lysogenization K family protein [Citromicrobium phage vB_CbaS-RXM]|nr:high frequency of lysogenization K family protein [Citromicrobium phage vB_CbaS-RXM]